MSRYDDPFDTQLLRVFCTLLDERSVSRAAMRLNLSQPAVSAALKRLRDLFADPLLLKDRQRMVPTDRARALEVTVRRLLADVDALMEPPEPFDAARTRIEFRLGTMDYLAPPFLAAVVQYLRSQAPGARLTLRALGPDYDYETALAEGALDVVIGNWPQPPERLRRTVLIDDEIVCLVDRAHPHADGLNAEQYLAALHVVPTPYSPSHRGVVETHLAQLHLARRVAVTLPYFGLAPPLLVGTDLVFTTARRFAEHWAGTLPLAVVRAPLEFPRMSFYQLWHSAGHASQSTAWFRSLLSAVARTDGAIERLRRTGEVGR